MMEKGVPVWNVAMPFSWKLFRSARTTFESEPTFGRS
jgi:hypothetical protein